MRRILWLAVVVLGCGTTTLSAKGHQVQRLDADPGPECASLGTVGGSADPFFGGLKSTEQLVESAQNEALNEAGHRGATHARFVGAPERWPSATFGGGQGVSVSGVAYRCEQLPAPSTPPAPADLGCTKDTDCKGDRICESRTCVELHRTRAP